MQRPIAHGHSGQRGMMLVLWVMSAPVALAESPADRFLDELESDATVPREVREAVQVAWADGKDYADKDLLIQGLAVLSPEFRAGLEACVAGHYERCAAIMSELRADPNPFVATNAAVYEVQALVAADRLTAAAERIEALLAEGESTLNAYSYFSAEIAFLRGYCMLGDLQYEAAAAALNEFIEEHPTAAEQLTTAARRMLAQLAKRHPGGLGEVVDLMDNATRQLAEGDSDMHVQQTQQQIVTLLDQLIAQAEEQEQNDGGRGAGSGSPAGQSPQSPMTESQLPTGGLSGGTLGPGRRADPAEAWGAMPPAQRERVLQALDATFPPRYRQLVEQYYEELAKKH